MPTTKVTMLFELTTADASYQPLRESGWTESHYYDGDPGFDTMGRIMAAGSGTSPGILPKRAILLPQTGRIVAIRVQRVSPAPVGMSQTASVYYPGTNLAACDQPGTAVQVNIPGVGVANVSRVELRGIPDDQILKGAWVPSDAYAAAMRDYYSSLAIYRFLGRDLGAVPWPIHDIDAAGNVTTTLPPGFAVGANVQVLRTLNGSGRKVGGIYQVLSVGPLPTKFRLDNWNLGATTGGKVRTSGHVFPSYDYLRARVKQATTRKVGRPFDLYRGRRSVPH